MVDEKYIHEACHHIRRMSKSFNWMFKANPVLQWEFSNPHDYHRAVCELYQSFSTSPLFEVRDNHPGVVEMDCRGVTFRLVCLELIYEKR